MQSRVCPPLPKIEPKREFVRLICNIGLGKLEVDSGYDQLRSLVAEYLWPGASLRHGDILGHVLAYALFPPSSWPRPSVGAAQVTLAPDHDERVRCDLKESWNAAADEEASPLAIDRAVLTLARDLLLACFQPGIKEGYEVVVEKKLRKIFPPAPVYIY